MRRFYAAPHQFQNDEVHLSFDESRHLRDVLRLREGEKVSVFDGEGREFNCLVKKLGCNKNHAVLELIGRSDLPPRESNLRATLAIALMKGDKFDLVVQKATELGVTKIVPLITKRADVKIRPDEAGKRLDRWQRIALEAAKQSNRTALPGIAEPTELAKLVTSTGDTKLFFSERSGTSLKQFAAQNPALENIIVFIGPEGGWEDGEIALARENGANIITLGGRILRAETAGITVTALIQNIWGDLN
jgi:16S rRNA (uracil1498-N3)-methyltransferase